MGSESQNKHCYSNKYLGDQYVCVLILGDFQKHIWKDRGIG